MIKKEAAISDLGKRGRSDLLLISSFSVLLRKEVEYRINKTKIISCPGKFLTDFIEGCGKKQTTRPLILLSLFWLGAMLAVLVITEALTAQR